MVTLPAILDQWCARSAPVPLMAIELVLSAGFGIAFWWNTRSLGAGKLTSMSAVLLVFQIALSTFSPELAFIVAGQLALMMPVRTALKWLAAQSGVLVTLTAIAAAAGDFVPTDTLAHTPAAISVPGTILYMLAWTSFAFGAGYLAASETRAHRDLARAHAELLATQTLLADGARAAERLRISRELHDAVGHHLAGLSINLQLASRLAEGPAAEPVRDAHLVAKVLLAEVRGVVGTLRDPRQTDLRQALGALSAGVAQPQIHLDLPDDLERLDPACAHVLFRCVQEAITNAIKHSGARNLWVELKRTEAALELVVRDDGRGTAIVVSGNGLKGMTERLAEVGGQLKLESRAGAGFSLRASIPAAGALS